ncbi:VOC family protein [Epibacterium sp. SM1969]|uniref:VOC family protein n=1 Tax=Tritonibacter aquimaris TaxID=2663379 RepID=A0A844B0G8_9RHOB|nr:VOC family protein [Tritonibacter aquimaris]MQY42896.1 VOC family protein [Tritonibacter aquimaris]
MEQRVSLITLGVRDIERSTTFYRALGWHEEDSPDGVVAFDLLSQTLGLYPLDKLAEDIGIDPETLGQGAMTLGYNARTRAEVDAVVAAAGKGGGEILKQPDEVFWGGYHGYFRDLDGHIWEVAFNPFAPLRKDGAFRWSGY